MGQRLIFPGGGDFCRANPEGRRTFTRNGAGATLAVFFSFMGDPVWFFDMCNARVRMERSERSTLALFTVLPVSGARGKCGAEQTGGRAGNAVAGAATGGMRSGTVPSS